MTLSSIGNEDFQQADDANLKLQGRPEMERAVFQSISRFDRLSQLHLASCGRIRRDIRMSHEVADRHKIC